jgi:hypothetical protein
MPKKTMVEKFREFMEASSDKSNKPMTGGEIATAGTKKKRKAAAKKRSTKAAAKNKLDPETAKKSRRG